MQFPFFPNFPFYYGMNTKNIINITKVQNLTVQWRKHQGKELFNLLLCNQFGVLLFEVDVKICHISELYKYIYI